MNEWRRGLLLTALLAAPLMGCSDSGDDGAKPNGGGSEQASFSADIQPIFTASCALSECHSGASPASGLDLSAGQSYAALVGVSALQRPDLKRVLPAKPDSSYLYHRLTGQGSSIMPPGGSLPAGQVTEIRQWIEEGAQDN